MSIVGQAYTVDTAGNPVSGITITFSLTSPPSGNGNAFNATVYDVTSDSNGLIQLMLTPGASYAIGSAYGPSIAFTVPVGAQTPYALPNWVFMQPNNPGFL